MSVRLRFLIVILLCLFGRGTLAHDLTRLPLGDGKWSSAPKTGYVWSCNSRPSGGGAHALGPWFNADGTWDLTRKVVVTGSVSWPHQFMWRKQGGMRQFTGNNLPSHPTGIYPIAPDSLAFRYDRNPNAVAAQPVLFSIPLQPQLAAQARCVPAAIGVLLSGAALFNALDAPLRDAVAHEVQDACQGHPQESGVYHYHSVSTCVDTQRDAGGHSTLVGYVIDGFGIYGRYGENGRRLSSADLDACHGHSHEIDWNGTRKRMYHYHATDDFPYTVGCLRGTYSQESVSALFGGTPPRYGRGGPDLSAAAARLGISEERLRRTLGPPPPAISRAAQSLGISEADLRDALGPPR